MSRRRGAFSAFEKTANQARVTKKRAMAVAYFFFLFKRFKINTELKNFKRRPQHNRNIHWAVRSTQESNASFSPTLVNQSDVEMELIYILTSILCWFVSKAEDTGEVPSGFGTPSDSEMRFCVIVIFAYLRVKQLHLQAFLCSNYLVVVSKPFFLVEFSAQNWKNSGKVETLVNVFEIEQILCTGVDLESKTVYHISLQV